MSGDSDSRPSLATALRWDLTVRLVTGALLPPLAELAVSGAISTVSTTASLTALLVSFASLGPDLGRWPWVALASVATPVAVVLGTGLAQSSLGGTIWIFVLFVVHGAMLQAGVLALLAWFPVSAAGLLATLLASDGTDLVAVAVGAVAGAALAALLAWVVPSLVRTPRLEVPGSMLAVDTGRLARMVRRPEWADWLLPLLLGGLAAALLLVAAWATEGFRPYWAVFAMVSVLGPTAARTRRSATQTVSAALLGVALTALLATTGWPPGVVLGIAGAMLIAGALLLLASGTLSKTLTTPLPVLMAAAALHQDGAAALESRLLQYLVGAGTGLVVAVLAEVLARRMTARSTAIDGAPVS